jgi:predicted Zn-dependent protease
MFFPRLRKQAKWMFVLLALVFAVGFVGYGVGSGSGGLFNGKLFGFLGGGSGSSGTSVGKAQKEISKHPNQPKGYLDLANAYGDKHQTDQQIAALEQYVRLRPKDADNLRTLASLYLDQASTFQSQAYEAQASSPLSVSSQIFQPTGKLGTAIGTDPIASAVTNKVDTAYQTALAQAQSADQRAVAVSKQLTQLTPNDPAAYLNLAQVAESAQDSATAIAAYQKVLKLEPDSSDVPAIKQQIKQLRASSPNGASVGSIGTSG